MKRKPRLTSNPKSRNKRIAWVNRWIKSLMKWLQDEPVEAYVYQTNKRGRRTCKVYTVKAQTVEINRKLTAARQELEELRGGADE